MALYNLAANCEYGNLEEEMIHDGLAVGIRDSTLSEQLQMDADLTLEKAKKQIRQREAVHQQQCELEQCEPNSRVWKCYIPASKAAARGREEMRATAGDAGNSNM